MLTIAEPIDADALRIRHEYLDLPGLSLTVMQAARLLGVSRAHASEMLAALAREGFLETDDGEPLTYHRPRVTVSIVAEHRF